MILNIKHIADWEAIAKKKQKIINYHNALENRKRLEHTYKVNDKVLLERHDAHKYQSPFLGPYEISKVYTNGTVTIRMKKGKKGSVYERVNIRRLSPFRT